MIKLNLKLLLIDKELWPVPLIFKLKVRAVLINPLKPHFVFEIQSRHLIKKIDRICFVRYPILYFLIAMCSVVPDSETLHNYTVPGILQARILGWVALPFSRGSSQPRDWTQVSCFAGEFCTSWATREAQLPWTYCNYFTYCECIYTKRYIYLLILLRTDYKA